MQNSNLSTIPQTRFGFRILAGILAALFLFVSLPISVAYAAAGSWEGWFFMVCCLYGGIGLAQGAITGRWFNSPG